MKEDPLVMCLGRGMVSEYPPYSERALASEVIGVVEIHLGIKSRWRGMRATGSI